MSVKKVRLYNLEKSNYPDRRGDFFRSLQVFECPICGAITNEVIMGGCFGYGPRTCCPMSGEYWHHELENKLRLLSQPHPASYKRELEEEIKRIRKLHRNKIKDNIKGNPDFSLTGVMDSTRSFNLKKPCEHFFS